jgi:hypothetical protein
LYKKGLLVLSATLLGFVFALSSGSPTFAATSSVQQMTNICQNLDYYPCETRESRRGPAVAVIGYNRMMGIGMGMGIGLGIGGSGGNQAAYASSCEDLGGTYSFISSMESYREAAHWCTFGQQTPSTGSINVILQGVYLSENDEHGYYGERGGGYVDPYGEIYYRDDIRAKEYPLVKIADDDAPCLSFGDASDCPAYYNVGPRKITINEFAKSITVTSRLHDKDAIIFDIFNPDDDLGSCSFTLDTNSDTGQRCQVSEPGYFGGVEIVGFYSNN